MIKFLPSLSAKSRAKKSTSPPKKSKHELGAQDATQDAHEPEATKNKKIALASLGTIDDASTAADEITKADNVATSTTDDTVKIADNLVEDIALETLHEDQNGVLQASESTENEDFDGLIPDEYKASVPVSLSKDLADLAELNSELSKISTEEPEMLGIFTNDDSVKNIQQPGKEADSTNVSNQLQQEVEGSKKIEKHDSTRSKDTKKTAGSVSEKVSLLIQFKQLMNQQKSLMQKIAAIGNIPVFDPKKFDQLMKALPAIVAWQKAGQPVPSGGGNGNGNSATGQSSGNTNSPNSDTSGAQSLSSNQEEGGSIQQKIGEISADELSQETSGGTRNDAALEAKESADQIRKNMGIDISQAVDNSKDGKKVDTKKLRKNMDDEGYLESTVQQEEAPKKVTSDVTLIGEEEPELSKSEQAARLKMEVAQDKAWEEEAKRRAKDLAKKRKEAAKKSKEKKVTGKNIKITAPKKKKMSKTQAFIMKLNYFGLGKMKDEFIQNLGVMMDAGLPLLEALRTLEMEAKAKPYKKLVGKVVIAVETGSALWRAMDSTYFFEGQQVSMVKVGEEAGNLVENLRYLAEQSAKQRELKAKVKTAMIYPIIVFTMLTLIIFGLGMFVLPNLIQVIFSLGVPLPFITRMIVMFTNIFSEHGTILLPGVIGGSFTLLMLHKHTNFKVFSQWCIMKIPGIGTLIRESVLSQFGVTMGGLLQAGVPVTDALESLARVTSISKYQKFYYLLLTQVKLGDSFATAFSKIKLTDKCFPGSMQQLIRTGEKSGSLTKIMMKLSEIHEQKATDVAEKLPVILEPMLLLFIGSLVGTIALGVLAPIYSIVGNVGGG